MSMPALYRWTAGPLLLLTGLLAAPVVHGRDDAARVVAQVALIRHGIRAPTQSPAKLAKYAAQPWPAWPVGPGQLTAHGAQLMHALGRWYAGYIDASGLDHHVCAATPGVKIIADSTPRNRASAQALSQGLQAGCTHYHARPPHQDDPLFRGRQQRPKPDQPPAPALYPLPRILALQQVLLGCHGPDCVADWRAKGKKLPTAKRSASHLKRAGKLAENLMLEYAQGMPMADVGWGRLDAAGLAALMPLHNAASHYARAYPAAARVRGSTLLAHIAATLAQAAGIRHALPALAPPSATSVLLVGHDTGLAAQSGLLQLDWHDPAYPDDYPPGGGLIYQLLRKNDGRYSVRIEVAMPGLRALRDAAPGAAGAMHHAVLHQPRCDGRTRCPLSRFLDNVRDAISPDQVVRSAGNEPVAG